MAQSFSIADKDTYVDVEEDGTTGHVVVTLETPDSTMTVTVDAGDLARALVTASPTFAKGLGEIVQRAILTALDKPDDAYLYGD